MSDPPRPAERVTFYQELARRRRGSWLVSAICLVVSGGVGLVLSAVVTPMVLLLVGGVARLAVRIGLATPLSAGLAAVIHRFAEAHLDNYQRLTDAMDGVHGLADLGLLAGPLVRLAPASIPALIAGALVWIWLRGLFLRAGGEELVARLKARAADPNDPEERQLANIVEEMAIAAGAPAPRLFLIDSPVINAAAVGRSHRDGAVLVTRGLLEGLDRAETQAVVGRLVAAIGAGDVGVAHAVMAVFQTLGFFLTVLDLPLRLSAWTTFGGLLLATVSPRASAARLAAVGEGLEASLQGETIVDIEARLARVPAGLRKIALVAMFPLILLMVLSALMKLVLFLWTAFFLGPPMAMLWRNRCYWTDARAVKLVRDPDALARALEKIGASGPPRGGEGREYLFVSAPASAARAASDRRTMTVGLTPALPRRLARLAAMGAGPGHAGRRFGAFDWAEARRRPLAFLLAACLMALLVPLGVALLAMILFITAMVMAIALVGGLALVAALI